MPNLTDFQIEPSPAAPPSRKPRRIALAVVFAFALVAGWAMVAVVARSETRVTQESPWGRALVIVGKEPEFSPRYAMSFRRLERKDFPERNPFDEQFMAELEKTPDGRGMIEALELDRNEFVGALELPVEQWATLLESGRPPVPGTREVLGGAIARFDRFTLDGQEFRVVGRLRREAPGLQFGYLLPSEAGLLREHFSGPETHHAWLLPEGMTLVKTKQIDVRSEGMPEVFAPWALASAGEARLSIVGLALMALGGAGLQMLLLAALSRRRVPVLSPVLRELAARPGIATFFHVAYYGLFFLAMWIILDCPIWSMRIQAMLRSAFDSGMLENVQNAYLTGNIFKAAYATWFWNYCVATLLLVMLPSLVPVLGALFGLTKMALSFGVIGLGLGPVWMGNSSTMVYHSGTMVLELEAYIVSAFVVVVFTWYAVSGVASLRTTGRGRLVNGFKVLGSGALLVGIMLAIAAVYEAATILYFGNP